MVGARSSTSLRGLPGRSALVLLILLAGQSVVRAQDEHVRFFETDIRPLLIEHCSRCHGAEKQSGGLRIDSREALLRGGETGPAAVPGNPSESLMVQAVRRGGDLEMPPDKRLTEPQVAALAEWIRLGLPWPQAQPQLATTREERARDHWAFQPLRPVALPQTAGDPWVRTPVDAFILDRLKQQDLAPAPEADRRTLIRRVKYALTGLPPSQEEIERFVNDPSPSAYERLVDWLLESPQYGEQWARHWLDVARYSDTKGYVYAREERFWIHAWVYRDWVVRAFNSDLPYDRFLLLQIAADQVPDRAPDDLAAMGFLTLGRRFLGVKHDIIDDRIDVICRGTMGLTVGCARCHDHKYDPIPTADYYSLYGVFDSCREELVRLSDEPAEDGDYQRELSARTEKLQRQLEESREEWSARLRGRVADYLHAQTELQKYPTEGFDQILQKEDLLPTFVRRWETYLRQAGQRRDPVFVHWQAYSSLPEAEFAEQAVELTRQLNLREPGGVNPLVAEAFGSSPSSFAAVVRTYADLLTRIDAAWKTEVERARQAGEVLPVGLAEPAAEQLRQVLYGPQSPCAVPDEPIVHTESCFDTATCEKLWKLQGEVDRWIINAQVPTPYALTLQDRAVPAQPRIFRRGNPLQKEADVPRQMLELIAGKERRPFEHGSGRLELAQAIIDPGNPLTARVMVNRVWTHLFGQGLVATPSDFGLRAAVPSHPELLDWLAVEFIRAGWSLKQLHRQLLLSAAFRQSSLGAAEENLVRRALRVDPGNRLLWRMNSHRLSFEEFRDSLLVAGAGLDQRLTGKPVNLFKPPYPSRRTLYGLVDRQFFPGILRTFDMANPDLHIPQRSETTVPQQALFFLNHPLVTEQVQAVAKLADQQADPAAGVHALFRQVLQRSPTGDEISSALELVRAAQRNAPPPRPLTPDDWQYGYGSYDEPTQSVSGFTPLPHFTWDSWQGGPAWPDPKLGWVRLTATGGHPGNDRQHACIRRWTAPRPMTIRLSSKLIHEAAPGDGIRAMIVSSRSGLLQSSTVHQQTAEFRLEAIRVEAGERIDFLVDIGQVLNSDDHLWTVTLSEAGASENGAVWNSEADFSADTAAQLTPWEQLAQVLVCTNEFLFVD